MKFSVTTFQRVFDTRPNRDVVSLERLVDGLTHFLVKPKTRPAVERELRHLEAARVAWEAGKYASGRYWSELSKAKKKAQIEGNEVDAAVERELVHLEKEIRGAPKKDLRLWSPAHYPPESRRGSENVVHLSCLVLDYDAGTSIERAGETWSEYFHVVHTTWSHTEEHPKFRLILPLAAPVAAADWAPVYAWAEERTGHGVDPSNKGPGTTFALPAVSGPDAARVAFSKPGPLLDAEIEGLIGKNAPPPEGDVEPHEPNHFRIPIPGHELVQAPPWTAREEDPWDDATFPWT